MCANEFEYEIFCVRLRARACVCINGDLGLCVNNRNVYNYNHVAGEFISACIYKIFVCVYSCAYLCVYVHSACNMYQLKYSYIYNNTV